MNRRAERGISLRETFWWGMMVVTAVLAIFAAPGLWILLFWACCVLCFVAAATLEIQRRGDR